MTAPICLFTYSRLIETKRTLEALQNNYLASQSEIFIFSDGPKNKEAKEKVNEVRKYINSVDGFKKVTVFESAVNKGLANSIIDGVTKIVTQYGKVIVLEDDLVTQRNFLNFMNSALNYYEDNFNIQSINGFSLSIKDINMIGDVYFQIRPFSWGWATWGSKWSPEIFDKEMLREEVASGISNLDNFKTQCGDDIVKMFIDSINNENDSWYVRWAYNHFKNHTYSVYPKSSLVHNIGFGESGTHCKGINSYRYILCRDDKLEFDFVDFAEPRNSLTRRFLNYFSITHKILVRLELLKSKIGRKQVFEEIKTKFS